MQVPKIRVVETRGNVLRNEATTQPPAAPALPEDSPVPIDEVIQHAKSRPKRTRQRVNVVTFQARRERMRANSETANKM